MIFLNQANVEQLHQLRSYLQHEAQDASHATIHLEELSSAIDTSGTCYLYGG